MADSSKNSKLREKAAVPGQVNVLLVDDQAANLVALEALLQPLGHSLVRASSGEEALRCCLDHDFAVILLDVHMLGMDGFETARLIRGRKQFQLAPIIFLTAHESDRRTVEEAYSLGAVDFLVKPLVPAALTAKVRGFVELFQKTAQIKDQAEQLQQIERREYQEKLAAETGRVSQTEARLAVEVAALGRLHQLSTRLLITSTLPAALTEILDAAIALHGADMGHVQLFNPESGTLEIVAHKGFQQDYLDYFSSSAAASDRLWIRAIEGGKPVLIEDIADEPHCEPFVPMASALGYRALQATPLYSRASKPLGLITTHFRARHRLSERDLRLLDLYARQGADCIERIRTESVVRESEARKTAIVETALDCVITMNHHGKIVEFNPAAERVFGYVRAEALGKDLADLIIPARLRDRHRAGLDRYLATGFGTVLGKRIEMPGRRADGTEFPLELAVAAITRPGSPIFTAYLRDITEKKRTERRRGARLAVTQILAQARTLGEAAPSILEAICESLAWDVGLIWVVEPRGMVLRFEAAWHRAGTRVEEFERASRQTTFVTGIGLPGRVWCDGQPAWIPDVGTDGNFPRAAIARREQLHGAFGFPIVHGNEVLGVMEFFSAQVREPDPDLLEMVATLGSQIGQFMERQRSDNSLRESEGRLRAIFEGSMDGILIADNEGRCREVNPSTCHLFGVPREELLGRHIHDFARSDFPLDRAWAELLLAATSKGEFRLFRPDDTKRDVEFAATTNILPGRHLFILRDISDRKGLEAELRTRADQLAEAARRKDEFLAMLAHELRNPLAPIRNALQILNMPEVTADDGRHARDMMERQVQHLVRLVDDLLDVNRILRNRIELRKECLDLAGVFARAVETAQPAIDAQRHQLSVALPAKRILLEGDLVRLAQIVSNLLVNSAKYTDKGGRIWLTGTRDGDGAVISVRDTGMGIDPELLPRIFDLFAQADRSLDRSQGGLGIGLTLVKHLTEMHGGRVSATSPGRGRGSEFVIRIPALPEETAEEAQPQGKVKGPARTGSPRRVLVVDDSMDAGDSAALLLRLQGHEVHIARDGQAALEAVRAFRPEVVLLDIGLPGMSGYEVAEVLRSHGDHRELQLIAVTGYGQDEDRRRSAEAGFDGHLVKPVDPEALLALLETPIAPLTRSTIRPTGPNS